MLKIFKNFAAYTLKYLITMRFQSTSHDKGSVLQSRQDLFTKHLMLCYVGLEKGQ